MRVAATAVVLVADAGLRPSVKPVEEAVGAAALVVAGAAAAALVAVPRGLSVKARPPAAAVVAAVEVLVARVTTEPKGKPVLAVVVAAAVATGAVKREEPEIVAAWVETAGAGVDEGLIPKAKAPP